MKLGSLYWTVERRLRQLSRGLQAVNHGVFLGLIDDFDGLAADFFAQDCYDDPDYNQQGWFAWEERAVRAFFPESGRVLVAAMGGGREVLALQGMGYQADGFDCVPQLVEAARPLVPDAQLWCTAPNAVPEGLDLYDAAIIGWGAYSCIFDPEARLDFLETLVEAVRPGAPILLSFFLRRRSDRTARWTHAIANGIRRLRGQALLPEGDFLTFTRVHAFTEAELRDELAEVGLSVEFLSADPYAHAVARRP